MSLEVIRAIEAALAASPNSPALHQHVADLYRAEGLHSQALEHYRKALDLEPNDPGHKLALAECYAALGKNDVALVVLEDLLRSPVAPPKALLLAARLYLATGQLEEAKHAYRQALVADPALADPELESRFPGASLPVGQGTPGSQVPADQSQPQTSTQAEGTAGQERERLTAEGSDEPNPSDLFEIERPRINFADVGGMEKLKEEIRMKIIYPLDHPDLFRAYGKRIGGGILMYGPPGCGKTYLARATAGEVKASFLSIGLHDVLDMYIGQSERNLHGVFEAARAKAPCVLFFDEVDALGANRADLRHSAMRQVINQFLSEMDGADASNEGILILAATNTPWFVDSALRRPGRFDRVLFVPPPDLPAREAILRLMLKDRPATRIDYARLARETEGFSGADLKGVVDRALEVKLGEAMRSGVLVPLTSDDLLRAVKQTRPSVAEWFETARNYALYSNEGGLYDDILTYLKLPKKM